MKTRSRWMIIGSTACALSIATVAHAALSHIGESNVGFLAVGPGGLKIEGSIGEFKASEAAGGKITAQANMKHMKTGIKLRDEHAAKAMNAEKHPIVTVEVTRDQLKFPADKAEVVAGATAKVTLNGTTLPLPIQYKVRRTGSDYHVEGLLTVDITKFKIEKPCYLGVCVDKEVKVKAKFKLREK